MPRRRRPSLISFGSASLPGLAWRPLRSCSCLSRITRRVRRWGGIGMCLITNSLRVSRLAVRRSCVFAPLPHTRREVRREGVGGRASISVFDARAGALEVAARRAAYARSTLVTDVSDAREALTRSVSPPVLAVGALHWPHSRSLRFPSLDWICGACCIGGKPRTGGGPPGVRQSY